MTRRPDAFRFYEQAQDALKRGRYYLAALLLDQAAATALTPEGRATLEERAREVRRMSQDRRRE